MKGRIRTARSQKNSPHFAVNPSSLVWSRSAANHLRKGEERWISRCRRRSSGALKAAGAKATLRPAPRFYGAAEVREGADVAQEILLRHLRDASALVSSFCFEMVDNGRMRRAPPAPS